MRIVSRDPQVLHEPLFPRPTEELDRSRALVVIGTVRIEDEIGARQLKIWNELQERRGSITTLKGRVRNTATEAEGQIQDLDARVPYTAIGRLSVSTVYDGRNLPRLYRLQDAGTSRTIAYLKANDEQVDLIPLLGQLIGIVGERSFDDGLRLNMIAPRRIDKLAAETPEPSQGG